MEKVSIIIPAYNAEKTIEVCLDSAFGQTYYDIEVIVVNDGSTDKTHDKIKPYLRRYDNLFYYEQKNQGQAVARNNAIVKSTGDYVTFLDSDDTIRPDMIEILVDNLGENTDLVWCNINKIENGEERVLLPEFISDNEVKQFILNNAGPCAKLIKKSLITENNLFFLEKYIYEDLAVVPAYALFAKNIKYVNQAMYQYMIYPGSTMNQQVYTKKLEDIFVVMSKLTDLFDKYSDGLCDEELEYLYIKHLLHGASLRFFKFEEGIKQIEKVVEIMKNKYPNYKKNSYYKSKGIKYKIICNSFYKKNYKLLSILLKG